MEGISALLDGVELDGVELRHQAVHLDARGSFTEVFSADRDLGVEPRQWSVVRSNGGSLRGMHFHRRHDEYVYVVAGVLSVGLHDLRVGSPTYRQSALYVLSGAGPASLTFPRGLVHGWVAHEPTTHLQAVSETHASYGADDNDGCRWDDPDLGITWPVTPSIISDRSRSFGSLADLRRMAEQVPTAAG